MAAMRAYFASTAQTLAGWSGVPVASTSKGACSRQSVSMGVAQDGLRTTREVCHASQQLPREKTLSVLSLGDPKKRTCACSTPGALWRQSRAVGFSLELTRFFSEFNV